ncbi:hypothetical protein GCM10028801_11630 [Nocardioides maradonensis]
MPPTGPFGCSPPQGGAAAIGAASPLAVRAVKATSNDNSTAPTRITALSIGPFLPVRGSSGSESAGPARV